MTTTSLGTSNRVAAWTYGGSREGMTARLHRGAWEVRSRDESGRRRAKRLLTARTLHGAFERGLARDHPRRAGRERLPRFQGQRLCVQDGSGNALAIRRAPLRWQADEQAGLHERSGGEGRLPSPGRADRARRAAPHRPNDVRELVGDAAAPARDLIRSPTHGKPTTSTGACGCFRRLRPCVLTDFQSITFERGWSSKRRRSSRGT